MLGETNQKIKLTKMCQSSSPVSIDAVTNSSYCCSKHGGSRAWSRQEVHGSKRDGACVSKQAPKRVPLPLVLLSSLHVCQRQRLWACRHVGKRSHLAKPSLLLFNFGLVIFPESQSSNEAMSMRNGHVDTEHASHMYPCLSPSSLPPAMSECGAASGPREHGRRV